jgi:hypothetical protein
VIAAKVPEGPPSRDPSRMDNEGFIRYWLVLAPLPAENPKGGAAEVMADRLRGESNLRPKAEERVAYKGKDFTWKRYKTPEFFIDFKKFVEGQPSDNVLAYALAYVYCDEAMRDLKVLAGSNDQCRVYVNGVSVLQHEKGRTLERDQSIANGIVLRKGENVVVSRWPTKGRLAGLPALHGQERQPIRHLQVSSTPSNDRAGPQILDGRFHPRQYPHAAAPDEIALKVKFLYREKSTPRRTSSRSGSVPTRRSRADRAFLATIRRGSRPHQPPRRADPENRARADRRRVHRALVRRLGGGARRERGGLDPLFRTAGWSSAPVPRTSA